MSFTSFMFFPTSFGTSLGKFWDKFWNAHWESWQPGSPGTGVRGACGKLRSRRQAAEESRGVKQLSLQGVKQLSLQGVKHLSLEGVKQLIQA